MTTSLRMLTKESLEQGYMAENIRTFKFNDYCSIQMDLSKTTSETNHFALNG